MPFTHVIDMKEKKRISRLKILTIFYLLLLLFSVFSIFLYSTSNAESDEIRVIPVKARQYAFEPGRVHLKVGETVIFKVQSVDVTHGFYVDGYDINEYINPGEEKEIKFTASKVGKFAVRCSVTCGPFHPYMKLEIIVEESIANVSINIVYLISIIISIITTVVTVAYFNKRYDKQKIILEKIENDQYRKINLPAILRGPIRFVAKRRWVITLILLANLAIFYIIIIVGLFGSQTGNQNLSIIFVWILWWFALITILVPFFGRMWCGICPLPSMGEWIQRGGIIEKKKAKIGLNKKWPVRLRNLWIVNFGFLGIALFSPFITTHPVVTGVLLGILLVTPIFLSLIFKNRVFCRYICPVGGFLGLYSNFSCIELRVDSREVCKKHMGKECLKGREKGFGTEGGYGCPWMEFPQTLKRNTFCGLCLECMKACPRDNINIKFRPFATDLVRDDKEKDTSEAWKGLIMLNLAAMYSLVLLGPYPFLREWATFEHGLPVFFFYVFLFLGTSLLFVPLLFLLFVALSRWISKHKDVLLKKLFIDYSMSVIPLGLMAWIAFSFVLLLVQWSYIPTVVSDPFGWGWDLVGMKDVKWAPVFPEILPYVQLILLLIGLVFSISVAYKVSLKHFEDKKTALKATIPIVAFLLLATIAFLRLFMG